MLPIRPLAGHSVFLLLIELALLVGVARLGAEFVKRLGLPAVVGELGAGILLGPSVFGRVSPDAFLAIFPHDAEQFHLLEVVGTLGMTFLLLLTGMDTDIKLVKNLGRAALWTSATGMLLPFGLGFALGNFMPDAYLADPAHRGLFSVFLATTMSISAMPVIAKILVDLDLTKRNIGLVILSAGVVDDTAGWLILSIIAGAATHGSIRFWDLGVTLICLAAFLLFAAFVLFPALKFLVRVTVERFKVAESDFALIVVTTFLCAAVTERIGVHAVFGAFVTGLVLNQVPRLRHETVARLETFVFGLLSPVFFGFVGLKVDLGALGGGRMFAVVLGVACAGKLIGCALGAVWGGLRFWEAASLAIAMNARGAMGIVAATIGLGLGILGPQMFSIIVMMAIVTSFMAPLGLRLTMPRVRMTADEQQRIQAAASKGFIDRQRVRVLIPTGGGTGALTIAPVAFGLARESAAPVDVLSVDDPMTWRHRLTKWLRRTRTEDEGRGRDLGAHIDAIRALAHGRLPPEVRRVVSKSIARAICAEAAMRGTDVIMLGSSREAVGGPLIEAIVGSAPCHVAIMRGPLTTPGTKEDPKEATKKEASRTRADTPVTAPGARVVSGPTTAADVKTAAPPFWAMSLSGQSYQRIFVPVDGSAASRLAVEFAHRYAENTGAELTLAVLTETRQGQVGVSPSDASAVAAAPARRGQGARGEQTPGEELERISVVFRASAVTPRVVRLGYDPFSSGVTGEVRSGNYDLIVIGAENRAIQNRLFFGYDTERLIRVARAAIVVVVPHVGRLV
jgi:Kef-type K+ transport system membrane component KefB/nucleotide-binding universal stress UspA family protein